MTHPSAESYRKVRKLLRDHRPLTARRSRRAAHYAVCVATREKSRAVWDYVRRSHAWRRSYAHVWPIRRASLDPGVVSRLEALRACETRGLSYWASYTQDGHHKGAYQYSIGTWGRAQAYYRDVIGRRVVGWTWSAHVSSPAHQDVITAFFFPSHTGEWSCRA